MATVVETVIYRIVYLSIVPLFNSILQSLHLRAAGLPQLDIIESDSKVFVELLEMLADSIESFGLLCFERRQRAADEDERSLILELGVWLRCARKQVRTSDGTVARSI